MTIDYKKLMGLAIPEVETTYSARDTMLYALSLGLGADPLDPRQLSFVYERSLQALPTMAVVLGVAGAWLAELDTGVDYSQVVHGSQELELLRPLPVATTVVGRTVVVEVIDKGPSRGAIVVSRRDLYEKASDVLLARITQSTFCRADGGFGGPVTASPKPEELPDRACDLAFDLPTSAQMALLYRLNGDYNRLHADPSVAQEAGFVRPILHGLASFGLAGWSIIAGLAGGQAERLHALNCRFTAPVYPGETLRADLWQDGETVHFRLVDKERDVVVVNNGYARLSVQ